MISDISVILTSKDTRQEPSTSVEALENKALKQIPSTCLLSNVLTQSVKLMS